MLTCTSSEWATNQYRDSLASFAGHNSLLSYMSVAENECKARVKLNLLEVRVNFVFILLYVTHSIEQKMLQPCGPPPEKEEL